MTCRTGDYQSSCPVNGGSQTIFEKIAYNDSFDRQSIILKNNALAEQTYTPVYRTGTYDGIAYITKSLGGQVNMTWDGCVRRREGGARTGVGGVAGPRSCARRPRM